MAVFGLFFWVWGLSHFVVDLLEIIKVFQFCDIDLVFLGDFVDKNRLIFVTSCHKSYRQTIRAKTTSAADSVHIVCIVRLFPSAILDDWHVEVNYDINLRNVYPPSQHVGRYKNVENLISEVIHNLVSFLLIDTSNQDLGFNQDLLQFCLDLRGSVFFVNKNHRQTSLDLPEKADDELDFFFIVQRDSKVLHTFQFKGFGFKEK